jgi:hypothetical protein
LDKPVRPQVLLVKGESLKPKLYTMHKHDPVESVVKHIPIVLPIVGAVLMFMLAFIAITMA